VDLDLELISIADRPALLALSTMEYLAVTKAALTDLGYKVHAAGNHEDFVLRFGRVAYQVLVVEELFAATHSAENLTLQHLQLMSMSHRRSTVSILIGSYCQTLNPMQAFQHSVHAVINPTDLPQIKPVIQQAVANHEGFLKVYRDIELRLANGKI